MSVTTKKLESLALKEERTERLSDGAGCNQWRNSEDGATWWKFRVSVRLKKSVQETPVRQESWEERHQKSKCSCSFCCLNHYILAEILVCWPTLKSDIWPIKGLVEFSICCSTLPMASTCTAQCQGGLRFTVLSWAECRLLNGHDPTPTYATNPAGHLTSWRAWCLEFVLHSDPTSIGETWSEKRVSGPALWSVADADATSCTIRVFPRRHLDTLQEAWGETTSLWVLVKFHSKCRSTGQCQWLNFGNRIYWD